MPVQSVGLTSPKGTINVTAPQGGQNPVTAAGVLQIDLPPQTGVQQFAGQTLQNPSFSVNPQGIVTSFAPGKPFNGVTSVGLVVNENVFIAHSPPVTSSGTLSLDMVRVNGLEAGVYANPTVTVDVYGRVVDIEAGQPPTPHALQEVNLSSATGTLAISNPTINDANSTASIDLVAPVQEGVVEYTNIQSISVNKYGQVVSVTVAPAS